MVAEFATTLHAIRLKNESEDGDEVAAGHEEVEDSEEASEDDRDIHSLLAEEQSCLIFQFNHDFSSYHRGLGHKNELTAHIREQLDAARAVKPRGGCRCDD